MHLHKKVCKPTQGQLYTNTRRAVLQHKDSCTLTKGWLYNCIITFEHWNKDKCTLTHGIMKITTRQQYINTRTAVYLHKNSCTLTQEQPYTDTRSAVHKPKNSCTWTTWQLSTDSWTAVQYEMDTCTPVKYFWYNGYVIRGRSHMTPATKGRVVSHFLISSDSGWRGG